MPRMPDATTARMDRKIARSHRWDCRSLFSASDESSCMDEQHRSGCEVSRRARRKRRVFLILLRHLRVLRETQDSDRVARNRAARFGVAFEGGGTESIGATCRATWFFPDIFLWSE